MEIPRLIKGGINIDDRGVVQYCNDFDFAGVRRFYTIQNHQVGFVRAWHGHRREAKYVTVVSGAALICAVPLIEFELALDDTVMGRACPECDMVFRFTLSGVSPAVLCIPGNYANGSMALVENTVIVHFSTMALGEIEDDDVRISASYFSEVWEVKQR